MDLWFTLYLAVPEIFLSGLSQYQAYQGFVSHGISVQLPIPNFDIPNTFHRVITKSVRLVNICGLKRNNEWNSIFFRRQYGSYLMTQFGALSRDTVTVLLVWYCFYVFWWDFWIFEKFLGDEFPLRDKLKLSALHSLNITRNKFWRDWESNPGPLDYEILTWE